MHYLLHLYKAKHCQFKASHLLQEITKTSISASIIGSSKSSPVPVKVLKHGLPLLDVGEQSSKLMDVNRPRLVRVEHVDHRPGILFLVLTSFPMGSEDLSWSSGKSSEFVSDLNSRLTIH